MCHKVEGKRQDFWQNLGEPEKNAILQGISTGIIALTVVTIKPDATSECSIFPSAGQVDGMF